MSPGTHHRSCRPSGCCMLKSKSILLGLRSLPGSCPHFSRGLAVAVMPEVGEGVVEMPLVTEAEESREAS